MTKNVMISIRMDRKIYDELMRLGNYSDYIRNLVIQDLERTKSPHFIKSRIDELKKEIQRLNALI